MEYSLKRILTGRKSGMFKYIVLDQNGNEIIQRTSNREYVACTINGQFFFGRLDLIGKGDHGRQVKALQSEGKPEIPIAYRNTSKVDIL